MKQLALYLILFVVLFSCKKPEDRSCFKSSGELSSIDVLTENFNELNLGKRLNYSLVHDTINFVRISGGKNLLKSIQIETIDNILYVENKNSCNFLRDLGAIINLEIHYTNLNRIDGVISHNLVTQDTIIGDYFNLRMVEASGNARLLVNTNLLNGFGNDGNSDYHFAGKTKFAHIQIHSGTFADVRSLQVENKLEISSSSYRDVYCRAEGIPLIVNLTGVGNVYYIGTPSTIVLNKTGQGNLIKID